MCVQTVGFFLSDMGIALDNLSDRLSWDLFYLIDILDAYLSVLCTILSTDVIVADEKVYVKINWIALVGWLERRAFMLVTLTNFT